MYTGLFLLSLTWQKPCYQKYQVNSLVKQEFYTPILRRNGSVSRFFILILKLIPSNITLGTYSRFENREKNGRSPYLIFFYGPRHEGTPIFILARVGAESRLFGAERKIKSIFKRWLQLEYTLKSIQ